MRRAGIATGSIISGVILGAVALAFTAAPAGASSFTFDPGTNTYTYVGEVFNVCGYGCPEHAPGDPRGVDYIVATLTFGGALAADLTNATPVPTAWTMSDHLNAFTLSGVGVPNGIPADLEDPAVPGLLLSTDSGGNIVQWIMSASQGFINAGNRFVGTEAIILNPPLFCGAECGGQGITDFVGVNVLSNPDVEWDGGRLVAAPVPEPGTLTLLGAGLTVVARRRSRARRS